MSGIPSDVQTAMSQFCAISRDEMSIVDKCKQQANQFKKNLAEYKDVLESFFVQTKANCVPITVTIDGQPSTLYLRNVQKTKYHAINESNFKTVVEHFPTTEELVETYKQLENPAATLADVYATWLFEKLYDQNTEVKTLFQISKTKERLKTKNQKVDEIKIPDDIQKITENLIKTQHNAKRLRDFKKANVSKFREEKKVYEPVIEKFLAKRPDVHQEQKITITMGGKTEPFYVRRVVEKRKPSLTLAKTKPLILESVSKIFKTSQPFDPSVTDRVLRENPLIPNMLFDLFCECLSDYNSKNTKISSKINLKDATKKRKTPHGDDVNEGNEDDGDSGDESDDSEE